MSLYRELKRRNVFRVAIAYLALAWLVTEVAGTLFPGFGIPDWAFRFVVMLLMLGFVPTLFFSWAYEITPEGLKREKEVVREESVTHLTAKRLDGITITLMVVVVVFILADRLWMSPRFAEQSVDPVEVVTEQVVAEPDRYVASDKSIAVLPFADLSPEGDQEYFSDGISETLTQTLMQVSGLKVIAKTSSFYFKGKNIGVGEIARELNVGTILEGSVQKDGNKVRVIAQLISTGDGTQLWSKSWNRDLEDIFAIQDEIAQEVVEALKVSLLDNEQERLTHSYQPSLKAYEQLILGRHEMGKRTAASLSAAEQHFKQAIELDSEYALPYVHLSETYILQVTRASLVFEEALQHQKILVERALELDPLSGEAYAARAYLYWARRIKTAEDNRNAKEKDILKALELNPNYARAHQLYSGLLFDQGRFEEALAQYRVAAELDPMSPIIQVGLARAIWNTGRAEEALVLVRRNIERNPDFPDNYSLMAEYQVRLGHLGEAQRWLDEARRLNPEDGYTWGDVCFGFLNLGDLLAAEDCAKQLGEAYPEKVVSSGPRMQIQAYQGNWKAAIDTLETSLERVPGVPEWRWLLADWIAGQGDVERARQLMADAFPKLMEESVEIAENFVDLAAAMVFAAVLDANGETRHRDVLLLALEERIATMHRIRGVGYNILDVYLHAIRGDHARAVASLREAIDMGWRISGRRSLPTWGLREDWRLGDLRRHPEFIALMNELEADINAQRQWYEENRDKPLF